MVPAKRASAVNKAHLGSPLLHMCGYRYNNSLIESKDSCVDDVHIEHGDSIDIIIYIYIYTCIYMYIHIIYIYTHTHYIYTRIRIRIHIHIHIHLHLHIHIHIHIHVYIYIYTYLYLIAQVKMIFRFPASKPNGRPGYALACAAMENDSRFDLWIERYRKRAWLTIRTGKLDRAHVHDLIWPSSEGITPISHVLSIPLFQFLYNLSKRQKEVGPADSQGAHVHLKSPEKAIHGSDRVKTAQPACPLW